MDNFQNIKIEPSNYSFNELIKIRDKLSVKCDEIIDKQKAAYGDIYPHISNICLEFNENQITLTDILRKFNNLKLISNETPNTSNMLQNTTEISTEPILLIQNLDYILFNKIPVMIHAAQYMSASSVIFSAEYITMRLQHLNPNIVSINNKHVYSCKKNIEESKKLFFKELHHLFYSEKLKSREYFEYVSAYSLISGSNSTQILQFFLTSIKEFFIQTLSRDHVDSSRKLLNDCISVFIITYKHIFKWFTIQEKTESSPLLGIYEKIDSRFGQAFNDDFFMFQNILSNIGDFCAMRQKELIFLPFENVNKIFGDWVIECKEIIEKLIPAILNTSTTYLNIIETIQIKPKYLKQLEQFNFLFWIDSLKIHFNNKFNNILEIFFLNIFQKLDNILESLIQKENLYLVHITPGVLWESITHENIVNKVIQTSFTTPFKYDNGFIKTKLYQELMETISDLNLFSSTILNSFKTLKDQQCLIFSSFLIDIVSLLHQIADRFFEKWYESVSKITKNTHGENEKEKLISCAYYSLLVRNNINSISNLLFETKQLIYFMPSCDSIVILIGCLVNEFITDFKQYLESIRNGKFKIGKFQNVRFKINDSDSPCVDYNIPIHMSDNLFTHLFNFINNYYSIIDCSYYDKKILTSINNSLLIQIINILNIYPDSITKSSPNEIVQLIFDIKCIYLIFLPDYTTENIDFSKILPKLSIRICPDSNSLLSVLDATVSRFLPSIIYLVGPIMSETALSTIQELNKRNSECAEIIWPNLDSNMSSSNQNFLLPIEEDIEQIEFIQI